MLLFTFMVWFQKTENGTLYCLVWNHGFMSTNGAELFPRILSYYTVKEKVNWCFIF